MIVGCNAMSDQAELWVKDTGIGILEDPFPFIFDCFYQIDKARSRSEGGVGLGLAIGRWIAEVHGSSMRVDLSRWRLDFHGPSIDYPPSLSKSYYCFHRSFMSEC